MNSLIRFLSEMIARPIERWFRSSEHLRHGDRIKIGNYNYALVPFVIALLIVGLATFLTVSLLKKPDELRKSLPWAGAMLAFAAFSFWMGTRRVIWVRFDDAVIIARLFRTDRYVAEDVQRWGFLYGRSDVRHDPPVTESTFLIEFKDGSEFERVVSPQLAAGVAARMAQLR